MNSSKFPQGSDECSSSESGWTAYIDSPENEDDQDHSNDEAEEDDEVEAESDDSMASDATSGRSYQHENFNKRYVLQHAKNENERKHKQQKEKDKKQHAEKIKAAKDKAHSATLQDRKRGKN